MEGTLNTESSTGLSGEFDLRGIQPDAYVTSSAESTARNHQTETPQLNRLNRRVAVKPIKRYTERTLRLKDIDQSVLNTKQPILI